jgi:hypothetical protein
MPDEDPADDDFWRLGPLPPPDSAGEDVVALDRLGRPDVTVEGRNLADVLRPAYRAMTAG